MDYEDFFGQATGLQTAPYPYQRRLAIEPWPDLLDIPTGLGKTAAIALAWIYKRKLKQDFHTPRRLVYCLPMRVLVEQTHEETIGWLDRLGMLAGEAEWDHVAEKRGLKQYRPQPKADNLVPDGWASQHAIEGPPIAVHLLMGGSERTDWVFWPERDTILIGTQDMLLSRALNRGYAAGRARWPMDFGLLNNDCLWVFDEVQLMSTGFATSLQLDAWRKVLRLREKDGFPQDSQNPLAHPSRSLWMSATMAKHWMDTAVDWLPYAEEGWQKRHCLTDADHQHDRVKQLFANQKSITNESPVARLTKPRTHENKVDRADADAKTGAYVAELAQALTRHRSPVGLTLVILNTVDRAIALYDHLHKERSNVDVHLIHSRFRPMDREGWEKLFVRDASQPRVIVSTQVVEAGVDISASVLFTELAPWASLVQRFGRCARFPNESGTVYWMDVGTHELTALPYMLSELEEARKQLEKQNIGLEQLETLKASFEQPPGADGARKLFPYDPRFVPREKDLFDLFDTTPDLTGADVDISRFIRDGQELDVQVFWRTVDEVPNKRDRPDRRELCSVPFYRFRKQISGLLKSIWRWNYRKGWELLAADQKELIYPGQVFLLEKSCGGYDSTRGWTGDPTNLQFDVLRPEQKSDAGDLDAKWAANDAEEDDNSQSELRGWVKLSDHSRHVCDQIDSIGKALLKEPERKLSRLAARWHDRGKGHQSFVANLKPEFLKAARSQLEGEPAAKAPDGKLQRLAKRDPEKDAWRRDRPRAADPDDRRRPGFRHELASALAILETLHQSHPNHAAFAWPEGLDKSRFDQRSVPEPQPLVTGPAAQELATLSKDDFDLLLYLVAAHHGKVRMSLRSAPDDARPDVPDSCSTDKRQARGVRDSDTLPACKLPDETGQDMEAPQVTLSLDPMELGLSVCYGPSWRERMQGLLERLGPFRLAYLEALLRIADWRASRREDEKARKLG